MAGRLLNTQFRGNCPDINQLTLYDNNYWRAADEDAQFQSAPARNLV
jgi:hypothetical protein